MNKLESGRHCLGIVCRHINSRLHCASCFNVRHQHIPIHCNFEHIYYAWYILSTRRIQ
ncbi:hypothetical protein BJV82DRAFT_585210 [Fennellomyces sp. T-0311]|nr:hypothetical protein BJV82DRAFT_585210 [Fennellomyces sp. T-0311]